MGCSKARGLTWTHSYNQLVVYHCEPFSVLVMAKSCSLTCMETASMLLDKTER